MRTAAAVLALLLCPPLLPAQDGPALPSPRSVLGFEPGAARELADWGQVGRWFRALDAASDRVVVEEVGRTTGDRPFLRVLISSPSNLEARERLRADNLRLADPRGLSDEDAEAILARAPVVVGQFHGIHSTEVAGTLSAVQLAWRLAGASDPATLEMLERTVVVLLPSHNPDGLDLVVAWHRRTVGTPYEGTAPPELYHRYVGHDNNRDWYMFTQQETRLTVEHVYRAWAPQVVHDVHQMGPRGPRMFLPPYLDPWEPNVDPALVGAANAVGAHVASRLTDQGRSGIAVQVLFDAWTPARAYQHTHGAVRVLSETASAKLATPVEVPADKLETGRNSRPGQASWNQPRPWPGGTWSLADAVELQVEASLALLEHAAANREAWLRRFLGVNRRAAARHDPEAWVIPAGADPLATRRVVEALRWGGLEVGRARAPFQADGQGFPAGSYVVRMQQPASAFAQAVLERQHYPDLREKDGTPVKPYDATAHTLPLLAGVPAFALRGPVDASLDPVRGDTVTTPAGLVTGRGPWIALPHGPAGLSVAFRLLAGRVGVRWAVRAFEAGGRSWPAGTLLVPRGARAALERLAREAGVEAVGIGFAPPALRLVLPRVGLYRSWVPSMDEGWTRYVFEQQLGVPFRTLRDADVRAGGLAARYDVIVVPDQARAQIVEGHAAGAMPPEYAGGLGAEGVGRLREFVQAGGTLVTFNEASRFAIKELGLPVRDRLEAAPGAPPPVYCPGSIVLGGVDHTQPLAHGLPESLPFWCEDSPAFEPAGGARAVVSYGEGDPLLSGWLLGGEKLKGAAALVDVPLGRGRVVLFGFRPQYRAQSWGTYVPMLNALLLSAAR